MSKYLKNLITACLAVCITVCVGIFAAGCDNKGDTEFPSSVTVTVVCDNGEPAGGVGVQICANVCLYKTTNANGVATFNINKDNGSVYEAHLDTLPAGYKYVDDNGDPYASDKGVQFDVTKNSSITITLVAE